MKKIVILLLVVFQGVNLYAQKKDCLVTLETTKGKMNLILYDETPLHKANFIKLAKEKFYDGLLFHRVIQNFMIQGGDPDSRTAKPGDRLGSGGGDAERIPFEYNAKRFHKKGVIAAARDNNPEKKSSAYQFYIVQGKKFKNIELEAFEKKNDFKYTPEQMEVYNTIGGTPHLDKNYSVFGEVIGSMEALDAIASEKVDESNRPLDNQSMKVSVKKMRKKKITRLYGYKF